MTSFFATLLRFVLVFARSLRDREFRAMFIVVLSLLVSGTIFYSSVEGWSIVDALYFSVATLTTTGYGDLYPTTPMSKLFTIIYLMVGIGVIVAFVTKLGSNVLKPRRRRRGGNRKPKG